MALLINYSITTPCASALHLEQTIDERIKILLNIVVGRLGGQGLHPSRLDLKLQFVSSV